MNADALHIAELAVQRYAESHPRPPHVTQIQAAKMLNLSRLTISKLIKSGILKVNKCGLIPVSEIDKVIAAHQPDALRYPKLTGCSR